MDSNDSVFIYFIQRRLWKTTQELIKTSWKHKRKNEIENYIWRIASSNEPARLYFYRYFNISLNICAMSELIILWYIEYLNILFSVHNNST